MPSPTGGGRAALGCGSGTNPGPPAFSLGGVSDKVSQEERLAAAHARLTEAIAKVATSEDWQRLLRISNSFHRYSPNNQLLLAVQGAEGLVASFNTWKRIPAIDGRACRIKKGSTALRVYAPVRTVRRDVDEETGDELVERSVTRFKLVPVFHQGQLVAPPDLPVQPRLLIGAEPDGQLWDAVARQIADAGFTLRRGALHGPDGAKGVTNWADRTVTVRDDLAPAQALKTEIHELGHVLLHHPDDRPDGVTRDRIEVEAESVAYVVCDTVGVDAGDYSIPYVANWAGADPGVVRAHGRTGPRHRTHHRCSPRADARGRAHLRSNRQGEATARRRRCRGTDHAGDPCCHDRPADRRPPQHRPPRLAAPRPRDPGGRTSSGDCSC